MLRVIGIFTDIAISPGLCLRQCPDRYAIRAGRNLPDKEFRYLRTVIVTAAVHQGLTSKLSPIRLTFWHWAGVSPYTSPYGLAETCVFGKQLPGLFRCVPPKAGSASPEVTHAFLPSSLKRVHSSILVFSTYPPVLDCGTDTFVSR